jgi:hypothetical protein
VPRQPIGHRPEVWVPGKGYAQVGIGQPLPPAAPHARGRPVRGTATQVVFSRHEDTKKGLLRHKFFFQCSPLDTFSYTRAHSHTDYDTVGAGQRSRPAGRQLTQISFNTLFCDFDAAWMAWHYGRRFGLGPTSPHAWTQDLLELLDSGTPFKVAVGYPRSSGHWDISGMPVTLRNLQVEERGGEPDTRYIDVQLVEYRGLALRRRSRGLPTVATMHQHGDRITWDLGAGQKTMKNPTLAKLAKHFYGSAGRWRAISKCARNKRLKSWGAHRDLQAFAAKHGRGKKGHKTIKIEIPELHKEHGHRVHVHTPKKR